MVTISLRYRTKPVCVLLFWRRGGHGRCAFCSGHVARRIENPLSTSVVPPPDSPRRKQWLPSPQFGDPQPHKLALCTTKRPANSPAYCSTNRSLRPLNRIRRPTWPRLNRFSLHHPRFSLHYPLWHSIPFSLTLDSSDSDNP